MFYRYSLTVPPLQSILTPVSTTMVLSHGIVHQVEVSFPPGCAALVHASIWHLERQVWPTNMGSDFAWDDYTIVMRNETFGLTTHPYELTLRGWSEDDIFPHEIACRIGIRKPEPHRPGSWVARLLRGETQG